MDIDALFLGAGASTAFGIPTMKGMVTEFKETLEPGPEKELYKLIENKLKNYKYFDLESLITVLQNIVEPEQVTSDILNDPSIHFFIDFIGTGWEKVKADVNFQAEHTRNDARALLHKLKEYLIAACTVEAKEEDLILYDRLLDTILKHHYRNNNFMEYIETQGLKHVPLDVFTTNYDCILEIYCGNREITCINGEGEHESELRIRKIYNPKLFDGEGDFRIRKLHGSVNWYRDQKGILRHSDSPVKLGKRSVRGHEVIEEVLLYPVRGLYAYREPFYDLFLLLKQKLERVNNWLVIGYSFRDKDITGLFLDAAEHNSNLFVCLVGLSEHTIREVVQNRIVGFKGRLAICTEKFSHSHIDSLLRFLQNPADSDVVAKSLNKVIGI